MAVSIQICNLALGDLRAPEINEIGDEDVQAQMCARYYPHCLDVLLDRHEWSFVTKLVTLAQLTTNDRALEWQYAYGLPNDVGRALRLLPPASAGINLRERYWPYPTPMTPDLWSRFEMEGDKLYCNLDAAVLEYASSEIEASVMPAQFREALRKSLAAALAVPLLNSREMKGDLMREAELAAQRAIADDMNRQPNVEAVDDVGMARRC